MNTTVPTLGQISGDDWKADSGALRDGLDQVSTNIANAFLVEHTSDNRHGTIHASGTISERGRTTPMGEWINCPFDATAYTVTGAGNSWTVPAPVPGTTFYQRSYTLIGKTMYFNLYVPASALVIAVGVNQLSVALPKGYRVAGVFANSAFIGRVHDGKAAITNGAVGLPGVLEAQGGLTTLLIRKDTAANFSDDSGGAFSVAGQVFFEVETI